MAGSREVATTLVLTVESGGERLDAFVARHLTDLSRSRVQRLVQEGLVRVDGRPAKASLRLRQGEEVVVCLPPPSAEPLPKAMPLSVVYEDDDILVIDKPAGVVVHPAPGHQGGTLVNAVLACYPELAGVGGQQRPGIVHRLDKDTSGLLVVAKNEGAHRSLSRQLKERQVRKVYLALVQGRLEPAQGVIDAPVGRHPYRRQRMAVVATGREAQTRYRVLRYLADCTLVEASPVTGRTHQIRVHLAAVGHPVVGDAVYGRPSPLVSRPFLHAQRLGFCLPSDGRYLEFESPLPEELRLALSRLGGV